VGLGFPEGAFAGVLAFFVVGTTDVWTLGIIITIRFGLVTDYPRRAAHDHGARHDGSRRDVPPAAGRAGAGRRSGATPAVPDHAA
jgi:hypothetical protein